MIIDIKKDDNLKIFCVVNSSSWGFSANFKDYLITRDDKILEDICFLGTFTYITDFNKGKLKYTSFHGYIVKNDDEYVVRKYHKKYHINIERRCFKHFTQRKYKPSKPWFDNHTLSSGNVIIYHTDGEHVFGHTTRGSLGLFICDVTIFNELFGDLEVHDMDKAYNSYGKSMRCDYDVDIEVIQGEDRYNLACYNNPKTFDLIMCNKNKLKEYLRFKSFHTKDEALLYEQDGKYKLLIVGNSDKLQYSYHFVSKFKFKSFDSVRMEIGKKVYRFSVLFQSNNLFIFRYNSTVYIMDDDNKEKIIDYIKFNPLEIENLRTIKNMFDE